MADRPIIFSGPMVRALLSKSKTQTRRVLNPQPFIDENGNFCVPDRSGSFSNWGQHWDGKPCTRNFVETLRPKPGDRLWVREAWRTSYTNDYCVEALGRAAIRQIAAGHNDPRGLATAVVIQFDASRLVRPGPSAP